VIICTPTACAFLLSIHACMPCALFIRAAVRRLETQEISAEYFFASICRIYIRSITLESLPFQTRVQALSYYWATSLAKARLLDPDDAFDQAVVRVFGDNAPGLFARAGRFGHWRALLPAPSSTGAARSTLHDLIRVEPQPSVLGLYLLLLPCTPGRPGSVNLWAWKLQRWDL
jgi:hypothetical protein